MEGLPSGDLQTKYQKLASEYSKLKVNVKVLKKGVLDEQAKSNELRELLKEKEKALRKGELENDSLLFRNQQLTRRVSVLQDELEEMQLKLTKKNKTKADDKTFGITVTSPLDSGLLHEELQKKILENAKIASQLADKTFEVAQLKVSLDDCQKQLTEVENKHKCDVAKLKNKNQELQYGLEEARREKLSLTPSKPQAISSSQPPSCNGDFISEVGSLIGSEDALSSTGDLVNEQIAGKMIVIEQENQKLKMEYEMLQMENESLKLEMNKCLSSLQKKRNDGHDSGDFNNFSTSSEDATGRVTGLLGSLETPFLLSQEVVMREERMKTYFRKKLSCLQSEQELASSKTEHYIQECEMLRSRLEETEREIEENTHMFQTKVNTITRLEEELQSTAQNYEQQMCVLTEHAAGLSEQLARQDDLIQHLHHKIAANKK